MNQNALAGSLLGTILVCVGLTLTWVGRQGGRGKLPRNHLAGIRTQATMKSDEAWNAAHKAAAPWLLAAGMAAILGGITDLLLAAANSSLVLWATTFFGLAITACVTVGAFIGQGAARETAVER